MSVPLVIAVAGGPDRLGELGVQLAALGLAGQVIDGADLGHSGWLLARVQEPDETVLDALGHELAEHWERVQIGDVTIAGLPVHGPLCRSLTQPLHEVVWSLEDGLELGIEAWIENLRIARARRDEHALWGRERPIEGTEPDLCELVGTLKGYAVALWRRGPVVMFAILDRERILVSHAWEPQWTAVGAQGATLAWTGDVDVQQVRDMLGLSEVHVSQLQAALAHGPIRHGAAGPEVEELLALLCAGLGVPAEAADVVAGRVGIEQLRDAEVLRTRTSRTRRTGASGQPTDVATSEDDVPEPKGLGWLLLYGFMVFSGAGTLLRAVGDLSWWRILLGLWVVVTAAAGLRDVWRSRRGG